MSLNGLISLVESVGQITTKHQSSLKPESQLNQIKSQQSSSKMKLIKNLLSSEGDPKSVIVIELTVVKDLGKQQFILADQSNATIILDLSSEGSGKVSVGERLKFIKPQAV